MYAWTFNSVNEVELFFKVCQELNADTEEKRFQILEAMAQMGKIKNVVKTKMEKKEYVEHLAKHFGNVLVVKSQESK